MEGGDRLSGDPVFLAEFPDDVVGRIGAEQGGAASRRGDETAGDGDVEPACGGGVAAGPLGADDVPVGADGEDAAAEGVSRRRLVERQDRTGLVSPQVGRIEDGAGVVDGDVGTKVVGEHMVEVAGLAEDGGGGATTWQRDGRYAGSVEECRCPTRTDRQDPVGDVWVERVWPPVGGGDGGRTVVAVQTQGGVVVDEGGRVAGRQKCPAVGVVVRVNGERGDPVGPVDELHDGDRGGGVGEPKYPDWPARRLPSAGGPTPSVQDVVVRAGATVADACWHGRWRGEEMTVALFFVALVASIVLHEAGHFWAARRFDMKVERFFIGFGPTLWSTRRGETEVGVKAIPAGGFVKIAGMSRVKPVGPEDEPRAFYSKPPWQRSVVLVSGVATHFLLAVVLVWGGLTFAEMPRFEGAAPVVATTVGSVEDGTAAQSAGIEAGDILLSVDGVEVGDPDGAVSTIAARPGETLTVVVLRGDAELALTATLPAASPDGERRGFLGVTLFGSPQLVSYGPVAAVGATFVGDASVFALTEAFLRGLGQAFSPSSLSVWLQGVDGQTPRSETGPISMVGVGQAAGALGQAEAWGGLLLLMVQVQIVVGLLNLAPLPPFDGGHLAKLGVESVANRVRGISGRSTDWEVGERTFTAVGLTVLTLLVGVAATAIYIDIVNPVSQLFE